MATLLDPAVARHAPAAGAPGSRLPEHSLNRFTVATGGSALALYGLYVALSNPLTEAADKLYFLSALAVCVLACLTKPGERANLLVAALSVLGFVVVLWGLRKVEHVRLLNQLWLGFRLRVALASICLLPLAGFLLRPDLLASKHARVCFRTALAFVAMLGALSFIQTRTSLPQAEHSGFIFNELYAPVTGHYPYTNYIPQYQTLFSYIFSPLFACFGADLGLNLVLYVLSALSLATVALGVVAGFKATAGLSRLVAPLLILPFVFITQGPGRVSWAGSIGALHSAFPVRMLLPTLAGVVLASMPALGPQRWRTFRHTVPLGAALGLACFHQLDFGLASALATGIVLLTALPWRAALRQLASLGLGWFSGFSLVPLLHWLSMRPLDLAKVGWFIRQFGGGFGAEPIQIPGPVLVVLPLLIGSTSTCLAALRSGRKTLGDGGWGGLAFLRVFTAAGSNEPGGGPLCAHVQRAAIVGSYFGAFALAAFPYYLNRSYASGQLQVLLLPLGIALAATAQIVAASSDWAAARRSARSLLFRLGLAIPVASLLLLPSPLHEWARLNSEAPETTWPAQRTATILALGASWRILGSYESVGYWGIDGNYIEAMTGLQNVTRFSSPFDGSMSEAATHELCAGIASPRLRTLILGDMAPDPGMCGARWSVSSDATGLTIAHRLGFTSGSPPNINASGAAQR